MEGRALMFFLAQQTNDPFMYFNKGKKKTGEFFCVLYVYFNISWLERISKKLNAPTPPILFSPPQDKTHKKRKFFPFVSQ